MPVDQPEDIDLPADLAKQMGAYARAVETAQRDFNVAILTTLGCYCVDRSLYSRAGFHDGKITFAPAPLSIVDRPPSPPVAAPKTTSIKERV